MKGTVVGSIVVEVLVVAGKNVVADGDTFALLVDDEGLIGSVDADFVAVLVDVVVGFESAAVVFVD